MNDFLAVLRFRPPPPPCCFVLDAIKDERSLSVCFFPFRAVVLLTCDAAQNRILLFVADNTGALINEYDLTKTYRLDECIRNPASATVDAVSNLIFVWNSVYTMCS